MKLVFRLVAAAGAACLLSAPALAAPVAGFATLDPVWTLHTTPPMVVRDCLDNNSEGGGEGGGEGTGEFFTEGELGSVIPVACDEGSENRDSPGPGSTDIVVSSIETGIEHCGQYTDVWRIDCISDELERMALKMPKTTEYSRAKSEILAASAKLRALAQANADPKQPPVRRAAKVGDTRRTTSRPIVAVAPSRVVATNLAADAVISELSTTLLRSSGNSASTARELTRVAQAVDSTKVLLRST